MTAREGERERERLHQGDEYSWWLVVEAECDWRRQQRFSDRTAMAMGTAIIIRSERTKQMVAMDIIENGMENGKRWEDNIISFSLSSSSFCVYFLPKLINKLIIDREQKRKCYIPCIRRILLHNILRSLDWSMLCHQWEKSRLYTRRWDKITWTKRCNQKKRRFLMHEMMNTWWGRREEERWRERERVTRGDEEDIRWG